MTRIVRTLDSDDPLLGVWCNECMRPFHVGERVLIEDGKAARHLGCTE
jgi:hypothetical protein